MVWPLETGVIYGCCVRLSQIPWSEVYNRGPDLAVAGESRTCAAETHALRLREEKRERPHATYTEKNPFLVVARPDGRRRHLAGQPGDDEGILSVFSWHGQELVAGTLGLAPRGAQLARYGCCCCCCCGHEKLVVVAVG